MYISRWSGRAPKMKPTDAIKSGLRIFDFLKGDEDYKARLGAKPRPLHRLEATT